MKKLSFTELYNMSDILIDQIRNETRTPILKELINDLHIVKKTIRSKQKEVIKQIQNKKGVIK